MRCCCIKRALELVIVRRGAPLLKLLFVRYQLAEAARIHQVKSESFGWNRSYLVVVERPSLAESLVDKFCFSLGWAPFFIVVFGCRGGGANQEAASFVFPIGRVCL